MKISFVLIKKRVESEAILEELVSLKMIEFDFAIGVSIL